MIQALYFLLVLFQSFQIHAKILPKNLSYGKKSLPLIEGGLGIITLNLPDYPGSGHNSTHTIPFPAFIYRGDSLRADDNGGMRNRFFKTERFEINLSFGMAPKARSENNPDREGMPDLDTIFEVGPGIIYHFLKPSQYKNLRLDLSIPIRLAVSTDFRTVEGKGFVFNPFLYLRKSHFLLDNMGVFLGVSTRFATEKNLANFYSVGEEHSNIKRKEYSAKGGFLGTNLNAGINYKFFNQFISFLGIRYSSYHLSSNQSSPLLVQKNNQAYVMGFVWWFYKSKSQGRRY